MGSYEERQPKLLKYVAVNSTGKKTIQIYFIF